jgi:putative membrane protein (TIGR04086 family)
LGSLALLILATVLVALGMSEAVFTKSFPVIQYLAAVWGGTISGKKAQRRGYLAGGSAGLLWCLLLYFLSSLVGTVSLGDWLGKMSACLLLGALGGIFGVNQGQK